MEDECLVPICYVGEVAGIPFIAMPLLKGQALNEYLAFHGGRLAIPDAVRIARLPLVPRVQGAGRAAADRHVPGTNTEAELDRLAELPRPAALVLHHPGVSADAIRAFAKKQPACRVVAEGIAGVEGRMVIEPTAPVPPSR